MKALVVPILRIADRWASQRIVRVATFGQGLSLVEWESLSTTAYRAAGLRVELVTDPAEAQVLAIHGPLTELSWPLLVDWLGRARPGARFLAVGADVSLSADGHLLTGAGAPSSVRMHASVQGHPPTPQELLEAVQRVMEVARV